MYCSDYLGELVKRADHIIDSLQATGRPLMFRDIAECETKSMRPGRDTVFLEWNTSGAVIWTAPNQSLHHVFHACLHLYRYWVEGVPQYWEQNKGCIGTVRALEACYEHMAVLPAEIAHFPEAYSYWVNYIEDGLFRCKDRPPSKAKSDMFQLYALAQTAFPRSQIAESIRDEAARHGWSDEFYELLQVIFKNYSDKAFVLENLTLYRLGKVPPTLGLRKIETVVGPDGVSIDQFVWTSLKDLRTPNVSETAEEPETEAV
ncbi:MAG: hypothetical protein JKY60_17470 [Kordiimonadaceae bacterium]|nr:hypothetical protein [Kordiimonadaceae bacterium]